MGKKTRLFLLVVFITLVEVLFHILEKSFGIKLNPAVVWIMPAVAVWDSISREIDAENKNKLDNE